MSFKKCPRCKASLKELKKNQVTVDVCEVCNGTWLDEGELEKLFEQHFNQYFASTEPKHNLNSQSGLYYSKKKHYKDKSLFYNILDFFD